MLSTSHTTDDSVNAHVSLENRILFTGLGLVAPSLAENDLPKTLKTVGHPCK